MRSYHAAQFEAILELVSGGIKGAFSTPSRRLCPPPHFPPSQKEIWPKPTIFGKFLDFAASETHFALSMPPPPKKKKKFWCRTCACAGEEIRVKRCFWACSRRSFIFLCLGPGVKRDCRLFWQSNFGPYIFFIFVSFFFYNFFWIFLATSSFQTIMNPIFINGCFRSRLKFWLR